MFREWYLWIILLPCVNHCSWIICKMISSRLCCLSFSVCCITPYLKAIDMNHIFYCNYLATIHLIGTESHPKFICEIKFMSKISNWQPNKYSRMFPNLTTSWTYIVLWRISIMHGLKQVTRNVNITLWERLFRSSMVIQHFHFVQLKSLSKGHRDISRIQGTFERLKFDSSSSHALTLGVWEVFVMRNTNISYFSYPELPEFIICNLFHYKLFTSHINFKKSFFLWFENNLFRQ